MSGKVLFKKRKRKKIRGNLVGFKKRARFGKRTTLQVEVREFYEQKQKGNFSLFA